ncbi:MAG TPA: transposase, partial [Ktedonobacteraceae bacterium]
MQLVEQHIMSRDDPRFAVIDEAAFKSKNLYNAALYLIRQKFIFDGIYLNYEAMNKLKLPKYRHKTDGRNILIYTIQALEGGQSKKGIQGVIKPSGLPITVKTQQTAINQVRIIPRNGHYVVEIIHSKEPVQAQVDPSFCVAIDLGVTNLAAITSNHVGFVPRLVNGRKLKSINQWYNKRMKELKLCLPKEERERVTKQMERITNKRNRRVNHYLHATSKKIIDFL